VPWRSRSGAVLRAPGLLRSARNDGAGLPAFDTIGFLKARRRPISPFILSLLVLGGLLYLMGWLPTGDAGKFGQWVRKNSAVLFFAGAALILTRNPGAALLAGMLAYTLTQKTGWLSGGGPKRTQTGNTSTVRTSYLEVSLDRTTGSMSGRMLQGRFAGRALSSFTAAERLDCLAQLRANDSQAARLFEAYLDSAFPGWEGGGPGAGPGGTSPSRGMGVEEAYLVLGLNPGATRGEIQAAHRSLMKRFHTDQGGSTYLASKVNEAKDVLLKNVNG
jgi:hypothetical protein